MSAIYQSNTFRIKRDQPYLPETVELLQCAASIVADSDAFDPEAVISMRKLITSERPNFSLFGAKTFAKYVDRYPGTAEPLLLYHLNHGDPHEQIGALKTLIEFEERFGRYKDMLLYSTDLSTIRSLSLHGCGDEQLNEVAKKLASDFYSVALYATFGHPDESIEINHRQAEYDRLLIASKVCGTIQRIKKSTSSIRYLEKQIDNARLIALYATAANGSNELVKLFRPSERSDFKDPQLEFLIERAYQKLLSGKFFDARIILRPAIAAIELKLLEEIKKLNHKERTKISKSSPHTLLAFAKFGILSEIVEQDLNDADRKSRIPKNFRIRIFNKLSSCGVFFKEIDKAAHELKHQGVVALLEDYTLRFDPRL